MAHSLFFGDIHNHCGSSYGHGTVEDALANARLQLDFCSVTGHSSWPDIGTMEIPEDVIAYHQDGFRKLDRDWRHFVHAHESTCENGQFVAFPSYESHSFCAGDYVVYHKESPETMVHPESFAELQALAVESGGDIFIVPHHIGYKSGYRGITWERFSESSSPLVEIVSMHGCSESEDAPFPPLHSMGPLDGGNTMQAGLARGRIFGVTGSTDHHSAHPGSYGYGLTGVWAQNLTMDGLWEAFRARRTYAVSGDRMRVSFFVDDHPMGSVVSHGSEASSSPRRIRFSVEGESVLDYVEIIRNNRVIKRLSPCETPAGLLQDGRTTVPGIGKLTVEAGWGEKDLRQEWNIQLTVENGTIRSRSPHFRGVDIVDPLDKNDKGYQFTRLDRSDHRSFHFRTVTWGNPTVSTPATQGCVLEIRHDGTGILIANANGKEMKIPLESLARQSRTAYMAGFLSPALRISRYIPRTDYMLEAEWEDEGYPGDQSGCKDDGNDFYYLRARQKNGHWAWTSPIWFR